MQVETIEDPNMKKVRQLDKLVDELAKGKPMKMLQVTIRTKKIEEELAFYKEIVGLKIVRDLREKGRGIVFLADSEGDTCIEIIDTQDGDNAGNKLLSIGFDCGDYRPLFEARSLLLQVTTGC